MKCWLSFGVTVVATLGVLGCSARPSRLPAAPLRSGEVEVLKVCVPFKPR